MKKTIKHILHYIAPIIFFYIIFSFVKGQFNFLIWSEQVRLLYASFVCLFVLIITLIKFELES